MAMLPLLFLAAINLCNGSRLHDLRCIYSSSPHFPEAPLSSRYKIPNLKKGCTRVKAYHAPICCLNASRTISDITMLNVFHPEAIQPAGSTEFTDKVYSVDSLGLRSCLISPRPCQMYLDPHSVVGDAWECLRRSVVYFRGTMVGTIAAQDPSSETLKYNQVFVRDFVPSALAFLMNGEAEIVKNFLLRTLQLQASEKHVDCFTLAQGVMPASFKVNYDPNKGCDTLCADFGESAIGRVAPVDSGFWWIFLLRAYTRSTGDYSLAHSPECQTGIKLILSLCLSEGFDTFPTLLCTDGCCMIDRRMVSCLNIYFFIPLDCTRIVLVSVKCPLKVAFSFVLREKMWQFPLNYDNLTVDHSWILLLPPPCNVIPESIPEWVLDFMTMKGGYFIGNVSPARMDFRWFALGNCIAILSSLATQEQSVAIMDLIEERWSELVGAMLLKVAYPALETYEWKIVTGCDPKNTGWSYHNGGTWPVLLWLLAAAGVKTGRPQIASRALKLAEKRLSKDGWPEYYDGKDGSYVGKQARKLQTWSVAGFLVAKMLVEDPSLIWG
ncbi:hypothetical protein H6P81_007843 [Aristolochia fimbriata]|uniref:Alkaline/neutral invertase n=1 Tax=Aristolochia fimbriata TaxID=158543 RepID=A0AAV7F2J7_ARIFI|nr:hypothetical protein H6P81_007843 [Aristolochia fimbriata]